VKLFGSKARGNHNQWSDVDILVVVDKDKHELNDEIIDMACDIMGKYDYKFFISVKTMDKKHFSLLNRIKISFIRNVNQDGIEIWKKD